MKKKLIMLFFAVFVLSACSDKTYEPREINAETDICKVCNMSIAHEDYAAQLVHTNGDYEMFDDLGCLMEYIVDAEESDIGAAFIKEMKTNQWLNVKDGIYVYSKDYWTPMNYGVVAFANKEAANAWIAEEGEGKFLSYEELKTFNWGIHH